MKFRKNLISTQSFSSFNLMIIILTDCKLNCNLFRTMMCVNVTCVFTDKSVINNMTCVCLALV